MWIDSRSRGKEMRGSSISRKHASWIFIVAEPLDCIELTLTSLERCTTVSCYEFSFFLLLCTFINLPAIIYLIYYFLSIFLSIRPRLSLINKIQFPSFYDIGISLSRSSNFCSRSPQRTWFACQRRNIKTHRKSNERKLNLFEF